MSGLDIEGVLDLHRYMGAYYGCSCRYREGVVAPKVKNVMGWHRAHVAAVLREQIAAWLGSEMQALPEYRTPAAHGKAELLSALAAQVAPSRVPGGES